MSLALDYSQIRREIGRFLGIGLDPDAWNSDDILHVADIIRSGLRRFYWHAVLPPSGENARAKAPHSWSFLKPLRTITLAANTSTYDLPDDFGELLEPTLTWEAGEDKEPIAVVSERQLRSLASQANQPAGTPRYAAIRAKAPAEGGPTLHEIVFYPTPGAVETVSYRASIIPQDLSETNQYPLGGGQHAETILESCLAAAEKTLHDTEGVHSKRYFECLAASIQSDERLVSSADDGIWPLEHQPNDLNITKARLKLLIGRLMGYGPHFALWTHKQAGEIQLALETGLRKFYAPPILPGDSYSHDWSFLKPLLSIRTASGRWQYDLPADFADFDGPLTYAPESSILYPPLSVVGEFQIRHMVQSEEASGRPRLVALSLKPLDIGTTAYEMLAWPVADGEYEIRGRYVSNPIALPEDVSLPFGGQHHVNTVIESCLAAAELQMGTQNGPHAKEFERCLAASVSHDRKVGSPESFGYNGDRSDIPSDPYGNWHRLDDNLVTLTGYDTSLYLN